MKKITAVLIATVLVLNAAAQAVDVNDLVKKVKAKLELANDYQADGILKTNISFLKMPKSNVKMYFKKPNKLKIKNEQGISFIPKGAVNMNMSALLSSAQYTVLDVGKDKIGGTAVQVVKVLPVDDNAEVVISTLYIDPVNLVIRKAKTTTKENGTYELQMTFGKYINYALPDKINFTFNTKDYKMPKGVTFDFDDGKNGKKVNTGKGTIELTLSKYIINKGVPDTIFN
jgi:outer membrane lipoprotein-sorting protein